MEQAVLICTVKVRQGHYQAGYRRYSQTDMAQATQVAITNIFKITHGIECLSK